MTSLDSFRCCKPLKVGSKTYAHYSLPTAEKNGLKGISRLPFSMKVLLENLLRNEDGRSVTKEDIQAVAQWLKTKTSEREIAFRPARVLMQDFTGVPAVVDLAAMRDAMKLLGGDPKKINPLVPVDLVCDHSVAVTFFGTNNAVKKNVEEEYRQNRERYEFLKWSQKSFDDFRVVPPGTGICHQVNLEYLSQTVWSKKDKVKVDGKVTAIDVAYPDTLVGTDSHTTMVNGLAVLGWGVGGIEAEAAMLGQPYSMLLPEVIGVKFTGKLKEGVTATDLVLTVTQMLRKRGVVGKFVEYFGPGLANLSIADRATIGNMSPEYGATCGFFPVDDDTLRYLTDTSPACRAGCAGRRLLQGAGPLPHQVDARPGLHRHPQARTVAGRAFARRAQASAGPRRAPGREGRVHDGDGERVQQGRRRRQGHLRSASGARHLGGQELRQGRRLETGPGRGPRARSRPRRRRDRRDHLLHQYLEPERDDRRRAAGAQGGGQGPHRQAVGQDLACTGFAGGRRISRQIRVCRRTWTSSATTWSASAAPPASAIPVRSRPRSPRRSTTRISSPRRCCPAIAISKAASTPTCARTIWPRRRWSSPMRSRGRCIPISSSSRSASTSRARRSSSRTSGPRAARSAASCARPSTSRCSPRNTPTCSRATRIGAASR